MPFIVGLSRSGTTLLRLMLDSHPVLAVPSGTFFIPEAGRVCAKSPQPAKAFVALLTTHWKWPDFHIDPMELGAEIEALPLFDLGDALRVFYRLYARRFDKSRWGDKSAYLSAMEAVQAALPEAVFVHLIRDGRDVALSIVRQHWGPSTIAEAADWWCQGVREARRQAARLHSYLEVRYEDLVAGPEPSLRSACAAIDLPFDAAMLDYHRRAPARLAEMVAVRDPNSGRVVEPEERRAIHAGVEFPPQASWAGRWRREMSEAGLREFEARAGSLLRELGYEAA
jgi:Sulfotransferase family